MEKFRVYVNGDPFWEGFAKDEEGAITEAARDAGQVWIVRLDTPVTSCGKDVKKISLHTDHDVPDMITDISGLKEVPLIHSRADGSQCDGGNIISVPLGDFVKGAFKRGPVKKYGAKVRQSSGNE